MPYRDQNTWKTSNMTVTVFVVLGVLLLAVPVTVTIFVLFAKLKQKKRAGVIKNATIKNTTIRPGPNGRTTFQTTASRPQPPRTQARRPSPPRSPILPYTQQQASKAQRQQSVKNAWKRLSRPFSMGPAQYQEDQIELTKQMPRPHGTQRKPTYEGPVSPLTPGNFGRSDSNGSWNTIDGLSSPVSPLGVINFKGSARRNNSLQNVPLTPPKKMPKQSSRGIDLGTARGFVPPSTTSSIKSNVVDANYKRVPPVALTQPPKARTKGKQNGWV